MHSGFIFLISIVSVSFTVALLCIWLRTRTEVICHKQPLFSSPASRLFFGQLDMAVSSHFYVFPDIPVASVIKGRRLSPRRSLLRKLKGRSFDYLLCDRNDVTVLCAISLDMRDESEARHQKHLYKLCDMAGIPLLAYEEKPYRNVPTLRRQIFASCGIQDTQVSEEQQDNQLSDDNYNITE